MEENGAGSVIRVMPTEGSIEKVIENIENIVSDESINSIEGIENVVTDNGNKPQALDNVIKNIYKVVDPWVNYYKHTDYAAGLERIEQCLNEKIKECI